MTRRTSRGAELCPRCRRAGTRVEPRGGRRFRQWLLHGDARSRWRCDNGHTWVPGTRGALYRPAAASTLPLRLLDVLRRRRTAEPVPVFMLAVAVVGVGVGIGLDLAFGWPWWLVALLVPALVWLGFLATAFRHRGPVGLLAELVGEIRPRRSPAPDRGRVLRLLASAPSPPLALAGWDGPRSLGGSGTSGDKLASVELVFGHRPAGPYVAVTTTWRHQHDRLPHRRDLAPTGAAGRWEPITLPVDGVTRPFTYLATDDGWVARAQLADVVIEIVASGVPVDDVRLARIADLGGYG